MLKNASLFAIVAVYTAENELLKVPDLATGENTGLVVSRLLKGDLVHAETMFRRHPFFGTTRTEGD